MTRDEAIAELTRRLVESYSPVRIYLFGSVARGDDGPESDLDFLVVIRDDTPEERLRPGAVRKAERGTGFARDIVPWRKTVVAGHRRHGASSTDSVRLVGLSEVAPAKYGVNCQTPPYGISRRRILR